LVPLERYDEDAPFHVYISSDAMIVMDFHSYLAHTEIIGLLGGKFDADKKRLEIQCTFPCKSTSTGIQCEMDPESEMRAREVFADMGMTVVGWYHSHPTFEPNPSVRDIENQSSYQSLFRHDESGLEPFIGVIVSPYDYTPVTNRSKIQYLSIGSGWDSSGSFSKSAI
jgi:protein MYSM1